MNAPPADFAEVSAENLDKGLVTKKGTVIGFADGDKASIRIETTNENKIVIDDDAETIELSDQHGNSVTLSKDGVVIKSAKDLVLEADGNVEIKGQKVDVK